MSSVSVSNLHATQAGACTQPSSTSGSSVHTGRAITAQQRLPEMPLRGTAAILEYARQHRFFDIVTRAALDVGSGQTKLTIADVDTKKKQILQVRYQQFKEVELRKDFAGNANGYLSDKIGTQLIQALGELRAQTRHHSPTEWSGIATSVFRKAKNGQELLDRIKSETGITVRLITPAEEGRIGFLSAVAISGKNLEEVIAWDSGSGSFQISTSIDGKIHVYEADFAYVQAQEALFALREQRFDQLASPNPVKLAEASDLAAAIRRQMPKVPDWLSKTNKKIVAIGGSTAIFEHGAFATNSSTYTKQQVWDAISQFCESTDEVLIKRFATNKAIVGLTLLYSVMDHCEIKEVSFFPTNGSCEGLLIDPNY